MSLIKQRCIRDIATACTELFSEWRAIDASGAGDPMIAKVGNEFVVPACQRNASLIEALDRLDQSLDALRQYGIEVR